MESEKQPSKSIAQYSLRSLLIAMAVVALAFALFAPYFRSWTTSRLVLFFVLAGGCASVTWGMLAWASRRRLRAESDGGELLLLVAHRGRMFYIYIFWCAFNLAWMLVSVFVYSYFFTQPKEDIRNVLYLNALTSFWVPGMMVVMALIQLRWAGVSFEIREHGLIISGIGFLPWEKLEHHRMTHRGVLFQLKQTVFDLPVRQQDKSAVDAALAQHLSCQKSKDARE